MKVAEFLLGSIPLLIQFYADLYREIDFEKTMLELESETNVPKIKTYDFIVVGGGSAGSLVASRLSEFFNVLLLEAGGTPPPAVAVPYYTGMVEQNPLINYFFKTVPQTNAAQNNDGIINSPTGRMLGGSGSHNAMLHNRGSPKDYDNWAKLLNDNSFNYTNVLKYYRKMENFTGPKFGDVGDEYYGKNGPIQVRSSTGPILDLWFDAARELGYLAQDPNAYQREGFTSANMAISNRGQRSDSYVEYIKPYEGLRKSLTIIRYANVSEILLDDNNKAYGVAFMRHGFPQIAHANNEIILSAGTYSSPLLLMKSGIGPESTLNAAEIPVKVNLEAVGKNLVNHVSTGLSDFSVNDTSLFLQMNSENIESVLEAYHNGEGALTKRGTTAYFGGQGFIVSSKATEDWPDIRILIRISVSIDGAENRLLFQSGLGRPQSKGSLTLDLEKYKAGIRDDVQLALIDNQLLTHPDDVEAMLEGIKFVFRIIETQTFKRINIMYNPVRQYPACSDFTFLSDDYWKCYIQQSASANAHPVGTCSMGPDSGNSTTSVVDTKFRVRGVTKLRIVDASVMPVITNANINAPVMMLAEKASEDIINMYQVTKTTVTVTTNTIRTSTNNIDTASRSTSILLDTNKLLLVAVLTYIANFFYQLVLSLQV